MSLNETPFSPNSRQNQNAVQSWTLSALLTFQRSREGPMHVSTAHILGGASSNVFRSLIKKRKKKKNVLPSLGSNSSSCKTYIHNMINQHITATIGYHMTKILQGLSYILQNSGQKRPSFTHAHPHTNTLLSNCIDEDQKFTEFHKL